MRFRTPFLVLFLTACSPAALITPYKIDVQQGNIITQDMLDKIKPGMTKSQIRFALGTPLIADPFHGDRWDYVYRFNKGGELTEERRLTAVFDGDKLKQIEGTALPPSDKIAGTRPAELIVPDAPAANPAAVATAPEQPNPPLPLVEGLKLDSNLSLPAPAQVEAKPQAAPVVEQAKAEPPKRSVGERFLRLFGLGKKDEVQQAKAEEKSAAQLAAEPESEPEAEPVTNIVVTADREPPPKRSVGERFARLVGFKEKEGDDPAQPVTTEVQTRLPRFSDLKLKDVLLNDILGLGDDKEKERKAAAADIEPGEGGAASTQGSTWQRFKRLVGVSSGGDEEEVAPAPAGAKQQQAKQEVGGVTDSVLKFFGFGGDATPPPVNPAEAERAQPFPQPEKKDAAKTETPAPAQTVPAQPKAKPPVAAETKPQERGLLYKILNYGRKEEDNKSPVTRDEKAQPVEETKPAPGDAKTGEDKGITQKILDAIGLGGKKSGEVKSSKEPEIK